MEAVIISIGEKAGELAFDLIKREVTYILIYKTNVEDLKQGVNDLKDAKQRVQHRVDAAKKKGRKIYEDVENWLATVDDKISEVDSAVKSCPSFIMSRNQLSKKAETEAAAIAKLLDKSSRFRSVSYGYDAAAAFGYSITNTTALNGIMAALKNDNSNIIGVQGKNRVAMARLVKELARLAEEEQVFDEVVVEAITQTPNIEEIQNEIAKRFQRRDRVKKEKKKKKILIILDDIWVKLNLRILGLDEKQTMGCKILLTSTKFNVLSSMGIRKPLIISSSISRKEEAWNLIRNMVGVGDIVQRSDLYFTTTIDQVAQKCAELPLAFTSIENTLKNNYKKSVIPLKNVFEELKRLPFFSWKKQGEDACDLGEVEFVYGSLRIMIYFGLGLLRVRVVSGSNYFVSDFFRVQVAFESGLFQVWSIANKDWVRSKME